MMVTCRKDMGTDFYVAQWLPAWACAIDTLHRSGETLGWLLLGWVMCMSFIEC